MTLTAGLGLALIMMSSSCGTTGDDYFMDTRTKANVFVAPAGAESIVKVAVMPFKGPTELIGTSVSDMFVTDLLRAGRYQLVERSQMAQVLNEAELALAGLSATRAVEVGNMMGADGVIIGTVDEYSATATKGHAYPTVGISARLIDCKSGKIVWSVDLAKKARSKDATLAEHGRQVIHEMISALYQKWR